MTRTARRITIIVFLFAILYAMLRYHVFKGVEWSHFPLFIIYVIMSFLLFRPEIYDKFFAADGASNAIGEWSMLTGALGFTALTLSALHVAIMGFEGWLTPREWPGGMPSITMVSMVVFLTGIIVFLAGQSKTQAK
jgi:hypothetical protein